MNLLVNIIFLDWWIADEWRRDQSMDLWGSSARRVIHRERCSHDSSEPVPAVYRPSTTSFELDSETRREEQLKGLFCLFLLNSLVPKIIFFLGACIFLPEHKTSYKATKWTFIKPCTAYGVFEIWIIFYYFIGRYFGIINHKFLDCLSVIF